MPYWLEIVQGSILFLLLLYALLWIVFKNNNLKNHTFCRVMILFAFIIRGLIAIINEKNPILPALSDVNYYHNIALDFARENMVQGSGFGASGFASYFIGNLYFILGSSPIIISLINSFIFSIIIFYLIKICFELNINNPWPVALIASIMPSSFLYIPVMLRESLFLIISVVFFYRLIILYKNTEHKYINHFWVLIYLFSATFVRPQVFPIYILLYILSLIYFQRGLLRITSVLIFLISIIIISNSNLKLFQFINSDLLNLYYFQLYRNAFSDLPNAYLVNIVYKDWFDFISYLPRFLIHFLFAPYPWEYSSYQYFMATIDSVCSLFVTIGSILAIIINIQTIKKYIIPGVVCYLIMTIPFAMIEAYPMGAVRHRMIITIMLLPIFSLILPSNKIISK